MSDDESKPERPPIDPEALEAWYAQTQQNIAASLAAGPRYIKVSLDGEPERWMVYDESC